MNSEKAKEMVIEAGKQLVEKGLIARTWGNVSCRISDSHFVITPSGRAYETLTPNQIVTVNIENCCYDGNVEPSSEKGVHAEIYKQRADINFVIHTHQAYASAVSPLGIDIDIVDSTTQALIGNRVVSIPYGLPGSKKLKNNVAVALANTRGKAYLMVSHGALCLGDDRDQAFSVAAALEQVCADYINSRYLEISGRNLFDPQEFNDYIVRLNGVDIESIGKLKPQHLFNSERTGNRFKLYLDCTEKDPFPQDSSKTIEVSLEKNSVLPGEKNLPKATAVHRAIYKRYREINAIIHTGLPDILTVSQIGKAICPLLDDFAQIIGVNVRVASNFEPGDHTGATREIVRKLKGRSAVLLIDNGALCYGLNRSDAAAAAVIMEKNCRAVIVSALFGWGKPINTFECHLMRHIYLRHYSKKVSVE